MLLFLCALEPMLGEPLTHGDIVEAREGIGHADGESKAADVYHNVGIEGSLRVIPRPSHLHIHYGVVGDVEGIGEFAEEGADAFAPGAADLTTCAHHHHEGEHHEDAGCIIDTIEHIARTSHAGDSQKCHDQ